MYGGQFTAAEIRAGLQNGTMPPDMYVFHPQYNQWFPAGQFLQTKQMNMSGGKPMTAEHQSRHGSTHSPIASPGFNLYQHPDYNDCSMSDSGENYAGENRRKSLDVEKEDWVGKKHLKWAAVTIVVVGLSIWGKSASIDSQMDRRERERQAKEAEQREFQKNLKASAKKLSDDAIKRQKANDPFNSLLNE